MLTVFFLAALIVAYVACPLFPGVELDHLSGRIRACREEGCRGKGHRRRERSTKCFGGGMELGGRHPIAEFEQPP